MPYACNILHCPCPHCPDIIRHRKELLDHLATYVQRTDPTTIRLQPEDIKYLHNMVQKDCVNTPKEYHSQRALTDLNAMMNKKPIPIYDPKLQ